MDDQNQSLVTANLPPVKKLKANAKLAEVKALANAQARGGGKGQKRFLALPNGGVGDAGNKKHKGGGKGQGKKKDRTAAGLTICFNWNKGKACSGDNCPHAHVCQYCEGDHRATECTSRG